MTFSDLAVLNQQSRSIAMLSVQSIQASIPNLNNQLNFMNRYLFGVTGSEGICTILSNYYAESFIWTSRHSLKPALVSDSSAWTTKLAWACSSLGDQAFESNVPTDSLYPLNGSGVPAPAMSRGCSWLANSKDSGDLFSGASVYGIANNLNVTLIGSDATMGISRPTQSYGVGLRGARTCDNTGTGPYGDGSPDVAHYFNDGVMPTPNNGNPSTNIRSAFLAGLGNLISTLATPIAQINAQITVLQKIQAGTNVLFIEAGMTADAPLSDIAVMQAAVTTINGWISTLTTYQTYFSAFVAATDLTGQAGYVKATFDSNLVAIQVLCATITSFCTARSAQIMTAMSNTPTGTEPTTGLRKWLVFWVSQLANKPTSPYYSLVGLSNSAPFSTINLGNNAEAFSLNNLTNTKKSLDTMIGTPSSYLEKPVLNAVYYNPIMDSILKTVSAQRISVVFNGVLASNRHSIFRHDITSVYPTDNSAWVEASYADVTAVDVGSGFVKLSFDDLSVTLGHLYVYRVQSFDTNVSPFVRARLDSYNTSSLQSDIFTNHTVAALSVSGNKVTTTGHELISGQMVHLSSTGKFYKVGDISPIEFTLLGAIIPNSVIPFTVTVLAGVIQL